jgi:hypothetical protein
VSPGQVGMGAGLAAYGCAFYTGARWWVRDDERLRKAAVSRWWVDRGMARRRGLTQEEWDSHWAQGQRSMVKWVIPAFMVLWMALSLGAIVHGLLAK